VVSAGVVDLIDEVPKVGGLVFEGLVIHQIDRPDPQIARMPHKTPGSVRGRLQATAVHGEGGRRGSALRARATRITVKGDCGTKF
jgi:hypothetical protein